VDQVVHIWEFGPRIGIRLHPDFLRRINDELRQAFKTKRNAYTFIEKEHHISFSSFKNLLKLSHSEFVPLEIFLTLCAKLQISRHELEENVVAYKSVRSHNYVENPKLPLRITPIFDMLIAHHIADGTVVDTKRNRRPYFSYRQCDNEYMDLYRKKMSSLCGDIQYNQLDRDKTRTYCPSFLSWVLFRHYGLNSKSFLSLSARVPEGLFSKNREHLLAFLIAFIVDEGSIDSSMIVIGLKNPLLAEDLYRICQRLGYNASYKERRGEYGYLHILSSGVKKFWSDYLELRKTYAEVDLGRQGRKLERSFLYSTRKIRYVAGNKKIVLDVLQDNSLTVNELADQLRMTRQGARFLVKSLISEGLVHKKPTKKSENQTYSLKTDSE